MSKCDSTGGVHHFEYVGAEASFGSTLMDLDVSICRYCGVVVRMKKGSIRGV